MIYILQRFYQKKKVVDLYLEKFPFSVLEQHCLFVPIFFLVFLSLAISVKVICWISTVTFRNIFTGQEHLTISFKATSPLKTPQHFKAMCSIQHQTYFPHWRHKAAVSSCPLTTQHHTALHSTVTISVNNQMTSTTIAALLCTAPPAGRI